MLMIRNKNEEEEYEEGEAVLSKGGGRARGHLRKLQFKASKIVKHFGPVCD